MKIIENSEFDSIRDVKVHPLIEKPVSIEVGQVVEITFDEWNRTYPPAPYIHQIAKMKGMKFSSKTDRGNKRWLIKKIHENKIS